MKAITIHQPWATLIALGEKRFETRGWQTSYRGPLVIHAGKYIDREACKNPKIASTLWEHGYHLPEDLPTGAVVAFANLTYCWSIGQDYESGMPVLFNGEGGATKRVSLREDSFGWFAPGRYAWEMAEVKQIEPVPAKGQQGLWNWGGERDASRM
ncbi:ASCH domain-containing protein [Brevibacillus massiliensis]|uniref:ASCH domain-containing protein n=1 Tax=Brevibacillus massiliensis TaxID=1118054 RepID=UPI0002F7F473|nr:ASCH domain-containing protein [Brevibacillus massiliensis]